MPSDGQNYLIVIRSSRMGSDDASVTDNKAGFVEWTVLNPDWLLSNWLFCERNDKRVVFCTGGERQLFTI